MKLTKELYLHQSRRLSKIVGNIIGDPHWTNYVAWEYHFKCAENIHYELELAYTQYPGTKRFTIVSRFNRALVFKTDSVKEAIRFINRLLSKEYAEEQKTLLKELSHD